MWVARVLRCPAGCRARRYQRTAAPQEASSGLFIMLLVGTVPASWLPLCEGKPTAFQAVGLVAPGFPAIFTFYCQHMIHLPRCVAIRFLTGKV